MPTRDSDRSGFPDPTNKSLFGERNSLFRAEQGLECTLKVRQINKEHFFWEGKCPLASDVYLAGSSSSRR
jgi:hypothetical protein